MLAPGKDEKRNAGTGPLQRSLVPVPFKARARLLWSDPPPPLCRPRSLPSRQGPQALKASRGAAFRLPVAQLTLEEWERLLAAQGLVPLAAEPDRSAGGTSASGGPAGAASAGGSSAAAAAAAAGAASSGQQHVQQGQPGQPLVQQQPGPVGSLGEVQARLAALRLCLCLGAEGQGVSAAVRQRCRSVSIPQPGEMESLNAAAAGSVLMFALSAGAVPLLADLAALPRAD